jgi:hypothetical protein
VNGHLELCGVVVFPGKSGQKGTTLPAAPHYLGEDLGVEDAVLLDNGGDVRLWYRGCVLVPSSEQRPEIRSMLGLFALDGAAASDAVSVS